MQKSYTTLAQRCAQLKPEKEKSLLRKHPWIFSGAIEFLPENCQPGELLPVLSSKGQFLALAYFHPGHSLCGRVLSFEEKPIEVLLSEKIDEALSRRKPFLSSTTTANRWINAEGDGLPGLIIDKYEDVLVIQVTTAGMAKLIPFLLPLLIEKFQPKAIYEKSHGFARQQEGLPDSQGVLWGNTSEEIEILENGIKFSVSLKEGQKTGFFLDQREMRKMTREISSGRKVMNAFSYTGGFSIAALAGGASHVDSIEISSKVGTILEKNIVLNGFQNRSHQFFCEDVFDFLSRDPLDHDLFIIDPPAFAKKRFDIESACKGYKRLMLDVFGKAKQGALLLFSSCSYYIDEKLLETLAFQAALEQGRNVTLLSKHRQAFDHPVSLFHPEGHYLKSLFLSIF
jgi:23S rRNA (cytosine1962-C5)-methyltransferase